MAKKRTTSGNGRTRLEEAMATLVQNQAAFVNRLGETDRAQVEFERQHLEFERQHLEFERRHQEFERETAARFARIEVQMAEIIRVLAEHGRLLERLPEAVRDKIGFKGKP